MALSFHPTTAPLFGCYVPAPDAPDLSFLQDVHPEVTDALLGFVYDPLDPANAALDDLLNLPPHDDDAFLRSPIHGDGDVKVERHCAKRQRACGDDAWCGLARIGAGQQSNGGGNPQVSALPELPNEFVLPLPLPLPLPPPPPQLPEPAADAKKATGNVSQSVQSAAARQRRKRISEKTAELSRLIPGVHKMNTTEMLEEAACHVKLLQAQVGVLALMRTVGSTDEVQLHTYAIDKTHFISLLTYEFVHPGVTN